MEELKCPKCGGKKIVKAGRLEGGEQRYLCRTCNKKFTPGLKKVPSGPYFKTCPICGHDRARKAGTLGKRQYYKCTNCGHKFLEKGAAFKHVTEKDKEKIISLFRKGVSRLEIVEETGFSIRTVFNILKAAGELDKVYKVPRGDVRERIIGKIFFGISVSDVAKEEGFDPKLLRDMMRYPYMKEEVSEEQKKLIYKFGVECKVPVDYLAPYVHCSQRFCKEFLAKFKPNKIPDKEFTITDVQKAFDKIDLDRFIK